MVKINNKWSSCNLYWEGHYADKPKHLHKTWNFICQWKSGRQLIIFLLVCLDMWCVLPLTQVQCRMIKQDQEGRVNTLDYNKSILLPEVALCVDLNNLNNTLSYVFSKESDKTIKRNKLFENWFCPSMCIFLLRCGEAWRYVYKLEKLA